MKRRVLVITAAVLVAAAFLSTALAAQPKPESAVAGKWTLESPDSPHGPMAFTLVMEQKGKAISASLTTPHGEMKLTGEFDGGRLTLKTADGAPDAVALSATLLKDGTLRGHVSNERGDLTWIGKRASSK